MKLVLSFVALGCLMVANCQPVKRLEGTHLEKEKEFFRRQLDSTCAFYRWSQCPGKKRSVEASHDFNNNDFLHESAARIEQEQARDAELKSDAFSKVAFRKMARREYIRSLLHILRNLHHDE